MEIINVMPCVSEAAKAKQRAYQREYQRKRRLEHPDKVSASLKAWRASHREHVLNDKKLYRERHPERVAAQLKRWRGANADKCIEDARLKYLNNPGQAKARASKRRAALLQRTPVWVDLDAIEVFYEACPRGSEVDHIFPLQGETVSGLHVLDNLQYLSMSENRAKGNRI